MSPNGNNATSRTDLIEFLSFSSDARKPPDVNDSSPPILRVFFNFAMNLLFELFDKTSNCDGKHLVRKQILHLPTFSEPHHPRHRPQLEPFFLLRVHPPNVKHNTVIILDHNFFCETSQSSDHQLSLEISRWNSLRRSQSSRHFCWPPLQHSSRERLNSRTHAVLRPLVGDYSCLPSPNRLPRLQQGQRLLITSGK